MKTQIKVIYRGPIDVKADIKITELIESIGGKWYAQGRNSRNSMSKERDICFDLEI